MLQETAGPTMPPSEASWSKVSECLSQSQMQVNQPFIWLEFMTRDHYSRNGSGFNKAPHLDVMKTCNLDSTVGDVRDMVIGHLEVMKSNCKFALSFKDLNMENSMNIPLSAFGMELLSPSVAERTICVKLG